MTRAGLVGLFIAAGCYQPPPSSPRAQPPDVVPSGAPAPQPSRAAAYLAVWDDDRLGGDHGARAVFGTRIALDGTILDPDGIALEDRFTAFETMPVAVATSSGWLAAWQRLDSDAQHFATKVLELADLLVHPDHGWPRSDKSGSYWASAKDARRLHPLKEPA